MAGVKSESSFDLFPQKTRQTLEAGESGHRNAPPHPTPPQTISRHLLEKLSRTLQETRRGVKGKTLTSAVDDLTAQKN